MITSRLVTSTNVYAWPRIPGLPIAGFLPVKRVRTFFPVWFVSRAVVLSIFVAETFLPFGGMESYDDIRFLGIVLWG